MIVVDTSALIAILQSEPEAPAFQSILSRTACVIGAATKLETLLVASRRPTGQADVRTLIAACGIDIVPWTDDLTEIAAAAFLRYGKGREHPARLNFGDCMAYALAKSLDAPLLYKGGDFALTDVRSAV